MNESDVKNFLIEMAEHAVNIGPRRLTASSRARKERAAKAAATGEKSCVTCGTALGKVHHCVKYCPDCLKDAQNAQRRAGMARKRAREKITQGEAHGS